MKFKSLILAAALAAITGSAYAQGPSTPQTTSVTTTISGNLGGYQANVNGSASSLTQSGLTIGTYVNGSGFSNQSASSALAGTASIGASYSPTGVTVESANTSSATSSANGSTNQVGIVTNPETGSSTLYNGSITTGSVTNSANVYTTKFESAGIGGVGSIGVVSSITPPTPPSNPGGNH